VTSTDPLWDAPWSIDDFKAILATLPEILDLEELDFAWRDYLGIKRHCHFAPDPERPKDTYRITGDNPEPIFRAIRKRSPGDWQWSDIDYGLIANCGIAMIYDGP